MDLNTNKAEFFSGEGGQHCGKNDSGVSLEVMVPLYEDCRIEVKEIKIPRPPRGSLCIKSQKVT